MSGVAGYEAVGERIAALLDLRSGANREFFAAHAEGIARCCHRMAERFARGGRLVALGGTPAARSDARHVAVEFVHPVIVGKRALPAIGLASEGGSLCAQVELIAEPADIAIAFGSEAGRRGETARALARARQRGCLTIAFTDAGAEWEFPPLTEDPFVAQELVETLYHVLWELVHVFFEHRGLLKGREAGPVHDTGASSFLYPFLSEGEHDLDAVLEDVRRSVLMKAEEVGSLRVQTLTDNREVLARAALDLRARFEAGGKLLAFGNGGSATDAIDAVADFREPPGLAGARWPRRQAIDLTEDAGILTAIANDIGVEEIFQRQVIAYGRSDDAAMALSTSGNSANIIEALVEARKRGLLTIAFVGYDGGRVAAEALADHVVVTRSQHIPRIQEAQASGYHVLRELVEVGGG
ncbi:MAG TPA: SIS domain-containing protein [Solirubrobacterales bacterium]|nr:SIS domain-containing protein [Solirubrobacterales bacterium]